MSETAAIESTVPTDTSVDITAQVEGTVDNNGEPIEGTGDTPIVPKFKVKVNGKELEITQEDLVRDYQLAAASREQMQRAAKSKKTAEALIHLVKTNPKEALSKLGVDVTAFIQSQVNEMVDDERMSPDEREKRDLQQKLSRYEKQEQDAAEAQKTEAQKAAYEVAAKDVAAKIQVALESVQIPRTHESAQRVAQYMFMAHKRDIDLSAENAALLVREDYLTEVKSLLGSADEDTLIKLLGDDLAHKIVKGNLKTVQKTAQIQKVSGTPPNQPTATKKSTNKRMNREEWNKALDQIAPLK